MGRGVPSRWNHYKSHGEVIKNTPIIAFKVPLKVGKCRNLLPCYQFTPQILMDSFPNLKYIIDLTATTRYYNKTDFTSTGIKYEKVIVPGQVVPNRDLVVKFFRVMNHFMRYLKPGELIGVHCTHGLNRTGFMICQYLINELNWDARKAIKEFELARGHRIERRQYVDVLMKTRKKSGNELRILPSNWRDPPPPSSSSIIN